MKRFSASLAALLIGIAMSHPARADGVTTPKLHVQTRAGELRVALTLDACMGQTDGRILHTLIDHRIKATIFATARWIRNNPDAVAQLNAHPDLFRVENHGANHYAAVFNPGRVFGVRTVGDAAGLRAEVLNGAAAVESATGRKPEWFRGATAEYSGAALQEISGLGEKVAGFSVLGDGGAMFSAAHTAKTIAKAHDGDVIIAHINQPRKPAGSGVVEGILALEAKGYGFVWLDGAQPQASHARTAHR